MEQRFPLRFSPLGAVIWTPPDQAADELFIGSSRGAAKTFYYLYREIFRLVEWKQYRSVYFRTRYSDIERLVFPEVLKIIAHMDAAHALTFTRKPARVVCERSGSIMYVIAADNTADTAGFQGGNIHTLGVDEAQLADPAVQETLPAIVRSVVGDYRTQIVWMANPNGIGQTRLKKRFIIPARSIAARGNVTHPMPYVHPITGESFEVENHWRFNVREPKSGITKLYEVLMAQSWMNPAMDYRDYTATLRMVLRDNTTLTAQWVENDWDTKAGSFFSNIEPCLRTGLARGAYDFVVAAVDHGRRKTAVVWGSVDSEGIYRVFDCAMYMDEEITDIQRDDGTVQPGKASKIMNRHKGVNYFVIDPAAEQMQESTTGARTIRKIYADAGLSTVICRSNRRPSGWTAVREAMAEGTLLIDRVTCGLLVDSLVALETKSTDSEDCVKWDGSDGQPDGDHTADALRYLIVHGRFEGESVPDPFYARIQKMLDEDEEFAEDINSIPLLGGGYGDIRNLR